MNNEGEASSSFVWIRGGVRVRESGGQGTHSKRTAYLFWWLEKKEKDTQVSLLSRLCSIMLYPSLSPLNPLPAIGIIRNYFQDPPSPRSTPRIKPYGHPTPEVKK